jgi:hypothetical protein
MPFGLCNVPTTFQKVVTKTFNKYLNEFMQVFINDFNVFGKKENHLEQLQKCLQECCINGINHNPKKCVFYVNYRVFVGCLDKLMVDLRKIIAITSMPTLTKVTNIKRFWELLAFTKIFSRFC